MPMVSIRHATRYRYRNPVRFGEHRIMTRPLESVDQRLIQANLTIFPDPQLLSWIDDVSGACVGLARFASLADELVIESRVTVDHTVHDPFDLRAEDASISPSGFLYAEADAGDLARSIARRHSDPGDQIRTWAKRFVRAQGTTDLVSALTDMTRAIRAEFAYALRLDGLPQDPLTTLETRRGSCRDFAVLMVEACRSLGIAARFTSGYVYSASRKSGRTGGGHTHAWVRAYLPHRGWCDFDPTNAIIGNTDLIRVAVVDNPRQAIPLHGTWAGEAADYLGMDVEVDIEVIHPAMVQRNDDLGVALRQA